jgi:O-antigen ligase
VWPLLALTLLAPISLTWSNAPGLTLRRSIFLLGSTLLGIYLGEKFSIERLLRWLVQALCVLMAASILLYFISPSFVVDYAAYDGAWKGLTNNKNTFGWYMSLAVAALVLVRFRHFRWLRYVFLLSAAVLLLLSRSATSLAGCVLMISMIPLWRVIRAGAQTRHLVYVLMFAAICTGIYFIWAEQELLFRVLGRDSTFTGRTDLWNLVIPAIAKHPIVGYGYGAFWSGTNNEVLDIDIASKWLPMGAHNGYLELCLAFGVLADLCHVVFIPNGNGIREIKRGVVQCMANNVPAPVCVSQLLRKPFAGDALAGVSAICGDYNFNGCRTLLHAASDPAQPSICAGGT